MQPHSVPLQFLSETGLIGAVLAMGGLGLLLFAALARDSRDGRGPRARPRRRAVRGRACAWTVHGFVDFDWDIPGVTIPALLFLGVLVAVPGQRRSERRAARARAGRSARAPQRSPGVRRARAGDGLGAAAVRGRTPRPAPRWRSTPGGGARAAATPPPRPRPARSLDPTAVRSLLAAADLAQNRGRLLDARRYLLDAVRRQPYSLIAWRRIMRLALVTADRRGREGRRPSACSSSTRSARVGRCRSSAGWGSSGARERLGDRDRHAAEPGRPAAPLAPAPTPQTAAGIGLTSRRHAGRRARAASPRRRRRPRARPTRRARTAASASAPAAVPGARAAAC